MEFKDRKPQNPGRVRLTPVSGKTNVYDMALEDGAGTNGYIAGTPLNADTFEEFRQDIYNYISQNSGMRGEKGEQGDPAVSISNKSFIVGHNSPNMSGWYKLGSVKLDNYFDYHAKILITLTFSGRDAPSGVLDVNIRRHDTGWENISIKWETYSGVNSDYIRYYASPDGELTLYAYIRDQYYFYRIDILCESNRDLYTSLFNPVVEYGGISQERCNNVPDHLNEPTIEYFKFYSWVHKEACGEDKIYTCTKTTHGLNYVYGAIVVPIYSEKLSGWNNIMSDNTKYGVEVSGTTVYVAIDTGELKKGFYCLIYGV